MGRRPQRGHAGPSDAARSRARVRGALPMMLLVDVTSSTTSDAATHLGRLPRRVTHIRVGKQQRWATGLAWAAGCVALQVYTQTHMPAKKSNQSYLPYPTLGELVKL